MLRSRTRRPARPAFTLVEILVVMAIISVLVALLLSAVQRVRFVATRTQAGTEISEMDSALKAAMKRYGDAPTLPSRLVLFNNLTRYTTNPPTGETATDTALRKRSADVLRKMFGPRLLSSGGNVFWDGSTDNTKKYVLEGEECLVFYLGGAQSTAATGARKCQGFSTAPLDPINGTGDRIAPFYEFKSARLAVGPSGVFFVFVDPYLPQPWGSAPGTAKPYAYFSSTNAPNTYSPYATSDCPSLSSPSGNFSPYVDPNFSTTTFISPNGFQIICAGQDGDFGPGGTAFDPLNGANPMTATNTLDNQANFSQSTLSTPR